MPESDTGILLRNIADGLDVDFDTIPPEILVKFQSLAEEIIDAKRCPSDEGLCADSLTINLKLQMAALRE